MNFMNVIGGGMIWLACAVLSEAKVVGVENGAGSGFLYSHRGNCFVIMPSHVHGRFSDDIPIDSYQSGTIGSATIIYRVPGQADISLGLVRGAVAEECGPEWSALPRSLTRELDIGQIGIIERARQQTVEGRQVQLHSKDFTHIRLVPIAGERVDLFGGTSGATVFIEGMPVGMVLEAESADAAWALRMDEIVNMLARFMGEVAALQPGCPADTPPASCEAPAAPVAGDPYEVTGWSTHPVNGATDPTGLARGEGPFIAPLSADEPIVIRLVLTDTDRLSQITIISERGDGTAVPQSIEIITDTSEEGQGRPNPMPRRDMAPDGTYDNRVGERFARYVEIRITSSWGGGSPIRIDRIMVD